MRVFLAHAKSVEPDEIEALKSVVHSILQPLVDDEEVEVIAGRDDFQDNAASAGGWKGWPESISKRMDWETGDFFYAMIVCPNKVIGKGTAEIVKHAIDLGRDVVALSDDRSSLEVISECVFLGAPKNYWSGWELR